VESNALKFAVCVRAHGIPGFPDPVFLGTTVDFKAPKGLNQGSPQFLSAMRTCRTLQKAQDKGGGS